MTWSPNQFYRYTFKQGMSGWDVWAIQISLNNNILSSAGLVEDGAFGPLTDKAVRNLQSKLEITVDGICGPDTQGHLCRAQAKVAEHFYTPAGLLRGQCEGESGNIIPATTSEYSPGNRDYGPLQDNQTNATQSTLHNCFNIAYEMHKVAVNDLNQYKAFKGQVGAKTDEEAWRLAVLSYNWPAAAIQIAAGHGDTWSYSNNQYKLSDPAPWIQNLGIPGVNTGWDWCKFYIDTKVVYVTSWSIA